MRYRQHFTIIDPHTLRENNLCRAVDGTTIDAIHFSRQQCEEFRYRVAFETE